MGFNSGFKGLIKLQFVPTNFLNTLKYKFSQKFFLWEPSSNAPKNQPVNVVHRNSDFFYISTKLINTLCEKNVDLFNVKTAGVRSNCLALKR